MALLTNILSVNISYDHEISKANFVNFDIFSTSET